MKQYRGTAQNIIGSVLGIVTRNPWKLQRKKYILVTEDASKLSYGFNGLIIPEGDKKYSLPTIQVQRNSLDDIKEGDCIRLSEDGTITVVWEELSPMNPLLLTEACDCRCVMCPQPPKAHDKALLDDAQRILNLVKSDATRSICLTGGEPTLLKDDFFNLLKLINNKHPETSVMLLTNGKSFSDFDFTKKFTAACPKNLLICVSLHSDVDELHDKIVGIKDSFYKTAMGLQNLARFRHRIEIRVVINKVNAGRLDSIANFIIRNFPFIQHCAFMGMEVTGHAEENYEEIWIDPYDYQEQLFRAVKSISRANLNVSIYNVPLCLVDPSAWGFARKSISGWKNDYLPVCEECSVKSNCCGIFTTSGLHQSIHIKPIAPTGSVISSQ